MLTKRQRHTDYKKVLKIIRTNPSYFVCILLGDCVQRRLKTALWNLATENEYPEFFLFKSTPKRLGGGWWNNDEEGFIQKEIALLFCIEMTK